MFPSRRIILGGDVFRDEHSLSFDGTDQYIAINGFSSVLDEDDAFTFVVWFKATNTPSSTSSHFLDILFSSNKSADWANTFRLSLNSATSDVGDGEPLGGICIDDTRNVEQVAMDNSTNTLGTSYYDSKWHHLVLTRPAGATNQDSRIYIDGKQLLYIFAADGTSVATDGGIPSDPAWDGDRFSIGQEFDGGSPTDNFTGFMSDFVAFDVELSSSQVATIYNGREPYNHKEGIASGNLQAWYRMGDGLENNSGTTIYDMSDNSNNGTMTNMAASDFTGDTP